jgi:hypothetical protein
MTENYLTGICIKEIVYKTNKSLDLNSDLRKTRRMIVHFDWFRNKWIPLFTESVVIWSQCFESRMHFL